MCRDKFYVVYYYDDRWSEEYLHCVCATEEKAKSVCYELDSNDIDCISHYEEVDFIGE